MNTFLFDGWVRDAYSTFEIRGKYFIGFILLNEDNSTIPIAVNDQKLIEYFITKVKVGYKLEVQGHFTTMTVYKEDKKLIQVFFVADTLKIVRGSRVKFKKNTIIEKLIDLIDPEDIYEQYKKKGEAKK